MDKTDEIVQYFVINKEFNMSPGKLASQVAHVATIITKKYTELDCYCKANLYISETDFDNMVIWNKWFNTDQKKIILHGKEKDLLKLIDNGFAYIRDNGLTEIPKGTLTCVGLPPMYKSEAQRYVKRLQIF